MVPYSAPRPRFLRATAAALLLALPSLAQLRGVTQITSSGQVHQDAKLSPDGLFVAYRGAGKIGSVGFSGGVEATLATSSNLGDFFWAPNSSGLYFIENSDLKFVSRGGGNPQRLATLPGQGHRIWSVDAQDKKIWGTRFDPATSTYHIFSVSTSGGSVTDLVGSPLVLDQVKIDPSGSRILYRETLGIPFSPSEIWMADHDGQNEVSLTGGQVAECPDLIDWVDNAQTAAFAVRSPFSGLPQLGRITTASTQIELLSEGLFQHRNLSVTRDKQWLLHQAQYAGGAAPAILPPDGGGLILLALDGKTYLFHGVPTSDAGGTRVVFAATELGGSTTPQIYTARLDRELRISPRAKLGQSFAVQMPIRSNEIGAVFISAGLAPAVTLPGFAGALVLNSVQTLVSGGSATGSLGGGINVPNEVALLGQSVFFQGLRVISLSQGDFTRAAEVPIF